MTQLLDKSMSQLYEKAYDKVYGKLSSRFVSRSDMEVILIEYYDLKNVIMERLLLIEIIQSDISAQTLEGSDSSVMYVLDYEDIIRDHILASMDEWNNMKVLYNREARQRKSRLSVDDLEVHHVLLLQLREHIHAINDEELTGIPNILGTDKTTKMTTSTVILKAETLNNKNQTSEEGTTAQNPEKGSKNLHKEIVQRKAKQKKSKPVDEKIERMQKKIAHLKAVALEKAESANVQQDLIKATKKDQFEINKTNKKLLAMNNALAFQTGEVKKENELLANETRVALDAASIKLQETVDRL